ncbi:unnamed protein product [Tetraodon nigroviridis]|uniref:(spotted green pufferfish) hypothetical protein n=1 Tax=Tetraodon nigroviridis TaxID=99883 RepID=Q4RMZ5_TETNG|nr:unnamed protein product [Tetraodon nigroviridis]
MTPKQEQENGPVSWNRTAARGDDNIVTRKSKWETSACWELSLAPVRRESGPKEGQWWTSSAPADLMLHKRIHAFASPSDNFIGDTISWNPLSSQPKLCFPTFCE